MDLDEMVQRADKAKIALRRVALMPWLREAPGGVVLELLVQPRASRTRVVGEHDGRLKVQLAAPPVDGRGQRGADRVPRRRARVRRADVTIERGDTGRRKTVRVAGVTAAAGSPAFLTVPGGWPLPGVSMNAAR